MTSCLHQDAHLAQAQQGPTGTGLMAILVWHLAWTPDGVNSGVRAPHYEKLQKNAISKF
jgi:hypothetical protein